jgi:hypothetical protein
MGGLLMSIFDWFRLPIEERQKIAGPQESLNDCMGFFVDNMQEMGELHRQFHRGNGE